MNFDFSTHSTSIAFLAGSRHVKCVLSIIVNGSSKNMDTKKLKNARHHLKNRKIIFISTSFASVLTRDIFSN